MGDGASPMRALRGMALAHGGHQVWHEGLHQLWSESSRPQTPHRFHITMVSRSCEPYSNEICSIRLEPLWITCFLFGGWALVEAAKQKRQHKAAKGGVPKQRLRCKVAVPARIAPAALSPASPLELRLRDMQRERDSLFDDVEQLRALLSSARDRATGP